MRLKRVGFFRELKHGDPAGPKLVDLVDQPQPDEKRIVDYLRNGQLFVGCPGVVSDVLDGATGPIGSPDILTDGLWAWPSDLPYYLDKYHIALPDEFVQHVRARNFKPPADDEFDASNLEL